MKYRIAYHMGNRLDVKTKVDSGILTVNSGCIEISGARPLTIPNSALRSVELFRLHGLGRMVKMVYGDSMIFLTVVRFNLFGYFLLINFLKTGALYERLKSASQQNRQQSEKI